MTCQNEVPAQEIVQHIESIDMRFGVIRMEADVEMGGHVLTVGCRVGLGDWVGR